MKHEDVEDALWEMVKANEDDSDEEDYPARNYLLLNYKHNLKHCN